MQTHCSVVPLHSTSMSCPLQLPAHWHMTPEPEQPSRLHETPVPVPVDEEVPVELVVAAVPVLPVMAVELTI